MPIKISFLIGGVIGGVFYFPWRSPSCSSIFGMDSLGPIVVQVLDFAASHIDELNGLRNIALESGDITAEKRHMRRRTNAHNRRKMAVRQRMELPDEMFSHLSKIKKKSRGGGGHFENNELRCRKHNRRSSRMFAKRCIQAHTPSNDEHSEEEEEEEEDNCAKEEAIREKKDSTSSSFWLPTHIWHAKRMKMVDRWGYCLAEHPQDKSISASHSAFLNQSVVYDASYIQPLELLGSPLVILEAMALLTDPMCCSINDPDLLYGSKEGSSTLFNVSQFPCGLICPFSFMWRPLPLDFKKIEGSKGSYHLAIDTESEKFNKPRQLWLWIHPAAYNEAMYALKLACSLAAKANQTNISIIDRRGELSRFSIMGKKSHQLLKKILLPSKNGISRSSSLKDAGEKDAGEKDAGEKDDEDACFHHDVLDEATKNNGEFWSDLSDHSCMDRVENGSILCLDIEDPRVLRFSNNQGFNLELPEDKNGLLDITRLEEGMEEEFTCPVTNSVCTDETYPSHADNAIKTVIEWSKSNTQSYWKHVKPISHHNTHPNTHHNTHPNTHHNTHPNTHGILTKTTRGENSSLLKPRTKKVLRKWTSSGCSISSLWSFSQRCHSNSNRSSDQNVDKSRRHFNLSNPLDVGNLSIMVVAQVEIIEGKRTFIGWDLIFSSIWSSSFLKALAFGGGHVIGLRDYEALRTLMQLPNFPVDYPDSISYVKLWSSREMDEQKKHLARPIGKRISYKSLDVTSPFSPSWTNLFENAVDPTKICVLRGKTYMEPFPFIINKVNEKSAQDLPTNPRLPTVLPTVLPTIVCVSLKIPRRGTIMPVCMICLPTKEDRYNWQNNPKWNGTCHVPNQKERKLIGYATSSQFHRYKSQSISVGFCECLALQQLFIETSAESAYVFTMIRNPTSLQYRPALLRVVV